MKILYVTTISLTINSFFKPHIEMLVKEGHLVDIACNADGLPLDSFYSELNCEFYQVDFSRSPLSFDNMKAYKQLKMIVENGNYDIVVLWWSSKTSDWSIVVWSNVLVLLPYCVAQQIDLDRYVKKLARDALAG